MRWFLKNMLILKAIKLGLLLVIVVISKARADELTPIETSHLSESMRAAAQGYLHNEPEKIEVMLDELEQLVQLHQLDSQQTLDLLSQAAAVIRARPLPGEPMLKLQRMMRRQRVPGPELCAFLMPRIKRRLHGDPPQGLSQAGQFVQRYNLPVSELLECVQQLKDVR